MCLCRTMCFGELAPVSFIGFLLKRIYDALSGVSPVFTLRAPWQLGVRLWLVLSQFCTFFSSTWDNIRRQLYLLWQGKMLLASSGQEQEVLLSTYNVQDALQWNSPRKSIRLTWRNPGLLCFQVSIDFKHMHTQIIISSFLLYHFTILCSFREHK